MKKKLSKILKLRPLMPTDHAFIANSWLESYYDAHHAYDKFGVKSWDPIHPPLKKTIFFSYHHKIVQALIAKPDVSFLIGHTQENPDQIICWACGEWVPSSNTLILHYIYTKRSFRSLGAAQLLLKSFGEAEIVFITHYNRKARHYMKRHDHFVYNPYLLYSSLPAGWARGRVDTEKMDVDWT